MTTWNLPLPTFPDDTTEYEITMSIENAAYTFYFNLNSIEDNLFLSTYGKNQSPVYFGSYRCCFGNYINLVDAGFPYLLFFKNQGTNLIEKINFQSLNSNSIFFYAKSR